MQALVIGNQATVKVIVAQLLLLILPADSAAFAGKFEVEGALLVGTAAMAAWAACYVECSHLQCLVLKGCR